MVCAVQLRLFPPPPPPLPVEGVMEHPDSAQIAAYNITPDKILAALTHFNLIFIN
jgi:hypothetical protein